MGQCFPTICRIVITHQQIMPALRYPCNGTWMYHQCSAWTLQGFLVGWKRDALHCIHARQQSLWYVTYRLGCWSIIQGCNMYLNNLTCCITGSPERLCRVRSPQWLQARKHRVAWHHSSHQLQPRWLAAICLDPGAPLLE